MFKVAQITSKVLRCTLSTIFSGVIGIIAVAASIFSAGTSILVWSFLVGDFLLSAGQLYISLEKMDDLGKGYGYTDPGIGPITQSALDNIGLLLTAVNLSLLLKHGAMKTLTETNAANCSGKIKVGFPNAKVEYSIDYGDTKELGRMAREELQKLIDQYVIKK